MGGATRAVVASIAARGWVALLTLLAVPWYVRDLGIEAYGVVGFFTSLQVMLSFLDLGLGATLTRELARAGAEPAQRPRLRDLARTFEAVFLAIALLISLVLAAAADVLARHWLRLDGLAPDAVRGALMLGGVALACQWPTALYGAGLTGLHRQAALGAANAVLATLRVALTLAVLSRVPTLAGFFSAQVAGALLQTLCLRAMLWTSLRQPGHRPRARAGLVRESLSFAGGMLGITATSIVLTQTDKLILSHALRLEEFGVYAVVSTLASGMFVLITPVFSVLYPRFAALLAGRPEAELAAQYRVAGQAMAVLLLPLAVVAAVFSRELLHLWSSDAALGERGAAIFALLVLANAANGVMHVPFALQLAAGWTRLAFWSNLAALACSVPATIWAVSAFGAVGGAAVWVGLNLLHIVVTPQFVHRRLLDGEKLHWYVTSVLMPSALSAAAVLALVALLGRGTTTAGVLGRIVLCLAVAAGATVLALPRLRQRLRAIRVPARS